MSFVSIGAGLIWYGQNYLIYPSAFPLGSRLGESIRILMLQSVYLSAGTVVDTPATFGLPYVPLDLKTEDDITLKCYLLLQQKDLGHDVRYQHIPPEITEDEACTGYLGYSYFY